MGYGYKSIASSATSMEVINAIQEILLEAGWTKTSDTGQWDGVSDFTSTSEYVMWSMPTNGGTLDPVVLKIHPNHSSQTYNPTFNLIIAEASDGAGGLTYPQWGGNSDVSSTAYTIELGIYYAYDDGGVVICGNHQDGSGINFFILIERKRNSIGAPVNGALATMFFQGTQDTGLPVTCSGVTYDLLGVSVFNTSNFAKTWGAQQISSPIADAPTFPKSVDGLTAPSHPVMFFGPDGGWCSNLLLVVQPSEGGTAMQAVVNGSPRYYRTVSTDVRTISGSYLANAYPIAGTPSVSGVNSRNNIVPSILNQ